MSGLASVSYVVTDEYGAPLNIPVRSLTGSSSSWSETLAVEARREGTDRDGRTYVVVATLTDVAGNSATATVTIVVPPRSTELKSRVQERGQALLPDHEVIRVEPLI